MSVSGTIKLNDKTVNHAEALQSQGYQVEAADGVLTVQANGVVEDPVDLSTPTLAVEAFQNIVREGKLCTYGTKFLFPDGKTRFSFPAAVALSRSTSLRTVLGFDPSCLITSVASSKKSRIAFPEGVTNRSDNRAYLAVQLDIIPAGL